MYFYRDLQKCLDLPPGKYHLGVRRASAKFSKWIKVSNDKTFNYDKISYNYHNEGYDENFDHYIDYDYNATYQGNFSQYQVYDYNQTHHRNLSDFDYYPIYYAIKSEQQDYDYGATYQGNLSDHLVWRWLPHDHEFGNCFSNEPDKPAYFICEHK